MINLWKTKKQTNKQWERRIEQGNRTSEVMGERQAGNYCTKWKTVNPPTAKHKVLKKPLCWKLISFYKLHSLLLNYWVQWSSRSKDSGGKKGHGQKKKKIERDGGEDFTLPLCSPGSRRAKWSCRTTTRAGSGWGGRRWADLSRSFCACRCQSCPGTPEAAEEEKHCRCRIFFFIPTQVESNIYRLNCPKAKKKKSQKHPKSSHIYFHGCRDREKDDNQSTLRKRIHDTGGLLTEWGVIPPGTLSAWMIPLVVVSFYGPSVHFLSYLFIF